LPRIKRDKKNVHLYGFGIRIQQMMTHFRQWVALAVRPSGKEKPGLIPQDLDQSTRSMSHISVFNLFYKGGSPYSTP
jgi:hypothetical protein